MGIRSLFTRKKKLKNKEISSPKSESTPIVVSQPSSTLTRHVQELKLVFNKFDMNGDGKISSTELGIMMKNLGQPATEEELRKMIIESDKDGDGFIDLDEFIELNTKDVDSIKVLESLRDAFLVFDVDRNGSITAEELCNVLRSLGEKCTVDECWKMISGVDGDGDGMVDFDEFKVMMDTGSLFRENEVLFHIE